MSQYDYARARATATRLISRFGQRTILRRPGEKSGPSYAPVFADPVDTLVTLVDLNRRTMTVDPVLRRSSKRTVYISATSTLVVEQGDLVLMPSGYTTIVLDGVSYSGKLHSIEEIRKLAPGGSAVMWEVDLEL